jgi:hypothetical protein
MSNNTNTIAKKPLPYVSLCGAIGFAVSVITLTILELLHASEASVSDQQTRVLYVMFCLLVACWSSIVSLITAWCPIILGGDRRPWLWVVPLILGWMVFVQWFDWASLVPHRP